MDRATASMISVGKDSWGAFEADKSPTDSHSE